MIELLSPREKEVLSLISQGLTNDEIAQKLIISEATMKSHLFSIYEKLDLACTTPKKSVLRIRAAKIYWGETGLNEST